MPPLHWKQLVKLLYVELASYDIAQVNLACAIDLPGGEKIDVAACLRILDHWAQRIRQETARLTPQFRREPAAYENSFGYFHMLVLATVLQREFGLRYNPDKIREDAPFTPDDVFIHGALQGQGGTCASLPVVYVAVGRRLGYPLRLAAAKGPHFGHLFVHWDDPQGERINVEATAQGLACPPDDYYRTGKYQVTPDLEKAACLLKSKTPQEELAGFLVERGCCWKDYGKLRLVVESAAWACALAPENYFHRRLLRESLEQWRHDLNRRLPPGFPPIRLYFGPRRFLETLPLAVEEEIIHLETIDTLLSNPVHDRQWWTPLRRGQSVPDAPVHITVRHFTTPHEHCQIDMSFDRSVIQAKT